MPGLIDSGWRITDTGSEAASFGEGLLVGGGRYSIEIQDANGRRRKLRYLGAGTGGGVGAHMPGAQGASAVSAGAERAFGTLLSLVRGAVNSLSLPSVQSKIYLFERFSRPAPLDWAADFQSKSILIISLAGGGGMGYGGGYVLFFSNPLSVLAVVGIGISNAAYLWTQVRAIGFFTGLQLGQVGVEAMGTVAVQRG